MTQSSSPHCPARLLLVAFLAVFTFAVSHAKSPNVLLIISDDQAWTDYGFMGHPSIKTPHLDQLATESLTFTRGYTPVALCRPALDGSNAMTSRQNPQLAPVYNAVIQNFARHPNFIRDLTSRGYLALQTGKWWEGNPRETAGFTHAMTKGNPGRHGDDGLTISRKGHAPIISFLDEAETAQRPWLIWHAPFLPHSPHPPPAEILARYLPLAPNEAVARYWANVDWFDQTCGELLAELEARGERENTIIIYVCDNGWIQGSMVNRFAPRSKLTPYEGGIRSPIMVSWRGKITPLHDDTHLASNLDVWPTLAALLGVEAPATLPGINLTDSKAVASRRAIYGEQFAHDIANIFVPAQSLHSRWTVDGDWKLIAHQPLAAAPAPLELFNLAQDPHETTNLAASQPAKAAQLLAALDAWWTPYYPAPREYRAVE